MTSFHLQLYKQKHLLLASFTCQRGDTVDGTPEHRDETTGFGVFLTCWWMLLIMVDLSIMIRHCLGFLPFQNEHLPWTTCLERCPKLTRQELRLREPGTPQTSGPEQDGHNYEKERCPMYR